MRRTILALLLLFQLGLSAQAAPLTISLLIYPGSDPAEQEFQHYFSESEPLKSVINLYNESFCLPAPLLVKLSSDPNYEVRFDPFSQEITIPYGFMRQTRDLFVEHRYGETGVDPQEATQDVVLFTLLRELNRIMIQHHDIPLFDEPELALNDLSILMLIEFFDTGNEVAVTVADLLDFQQQKKQPPAKEPATPPPAKNNNYLSKLTGLFVPKTQPPAKKPVAKPIDPIYFNVLCRIYGSGPDQYGELLTGTGIDEQQAKRCAADYPHSVAHWGRMIEPYLRPLDPSEETIVGEETEGLPDEFEEEDDLLVESHEGQEKEEVVAPPPPVPVPAPPPVRKSAPPAIFQLE